MDWAAAGDKRLLKLNEIEKFQTQAYENTRLYKEKTKQWHDAKIFPMQFEPRQQVLLFNSRLKLFPGKLKSRWSGSFEVIQVYSHGAVFVNDLRTRATFKLNGQRLKHYWGAPIEHDKQNVSLHDV
ncbi:uncharacterized protein [Gossypium hirsutum]|uniref:Uncharacterized protein n=1 Tax=Gossypium hirsutum TaxID=3635 RepID=A0ABM2YN13_GOSHI|nr:uncharacterized protein LOC121205065 [Gossypium hirsutum]